MPQATHKNACSRQLLRIPPQEIWAMHRAQTGRKGGDTQNEAAIGTHTTKIANVHRQPRHRSSASDYSHQTSGKEALHQTAEAEGHWSYEATRQRQLTCLFAPRTVQPTGEHQLADNTRMR